MCSRIWETPVLSMGVVRNPTLKAEKTNFSNNPEMSTTGDLKFGAFYCRTTFFAYLNIIIPPHSWSMHYCWELNASVAWNLRARSRAREQGWRSGGSTCLPPMWPGLNPGSDTICGLSLLLALCLAPRGFSPGTPVFPNLKNQQWFNLGCPDMFQLVLWNCYVLHG